MGDLNVGLFGARADRRGLATQTQALAAMLSPAKVMGFDLTAEDRSPYPCDWTPFGGYDLTVERPLTMDVATIRRWMAGLDVVVMCETPYRWEVLDLAARAGVATVVHANPEFAPWAADPTAQWPTLLAVPTDWRLDRFPDPDRVRVVPTPTDLPVRRDVNIDGDGPLTFLHVAGHPAAMDRAGTHILMRAIMRLRRPARILCRFQSGGDGWQRRRRPSGVTLEVVSADVPDVADLYAVGDVLVTPRRYGGQHLPLQEAAASGLPILATGVPPQDRWLPDGSLLPARRQRSLRTQGGPVQVWEANPDRLARRMEALHDRPDLRAQLRTAALDFAASRRPAAVAPLWHGVLAEAVEAARRSKRRPSRIR